MVALGTIVTLVLGTATSPAAAAASGSATAAQTYAPPPIKHVWVIALENESYNYTFGAAGAKYAPYLVRTLPQEGALLKNYYGTGHDSLDNYVAMVSGQSGNYTLNQPW